MPETLYSESTRSYPLLIVISGTSGVGKDAVIRELKARQLPLHFVITATSRPAREGEVHGREYFFYPPKEFEERIRRGEFIEHAIVYDEHKGIPRSQVEDAIKTGKDVVLKLDVQGAKTIRELYPQALLIFIMPRTIEELRRRLIKRKTETSAKLKKRLETANSERDWMNIFDYFVVNEDEQLEKAVDDIEHIINAEHHRMTPRKLF